MQSLKELTIRIDPLFWLLAFGLGFYYSGSFIGILVWGTIVFVSVLFHELGHALTALFFGQEANITLTFFGGVTKREGQQLSKWKDFLIILNGPLAGFLLAFLALLANNLPIVSQYPLLQSALSITYVVNIFWTFINLFPIQPLDGGHLLLILLQGVFGFRGIKIAYFLSGCIAALFGLLFFFFNQVFLGAIFLIFAFDSFKNWKSSLVMSKIDHNKDLVDEVNSAEKEFSEGNFVDAKIKLQSIVTRYKMQGGLLVLQAAQLLARILYDEGNADEAYSLLFPYKKMLDFNGLKLLQHIALKSHHDKEALELGTKIHQEIANSDTAFINALASAELKNVHATIGWLKTAIQEGLPNPEIALQNPRFEFLRSQSEFQNLLKF